MGVTEPVEDCGAQLIKFSGTLRQYVGGRPSLAVLHKNRYKAI